MKTAFKCFNQSLCKSRRNAAGYGELRSSANLNDNAPNNKDIQMK